MAGENSARLITTLEARVTKFEKDLARANGTARREFGAIERRSQQMTSRLEATVNRSNPFGGLAQKISGAGLAVRAAVAGFAAGAIGEISIKGVTDSIAALAKLNDTAGRTGMSTNAIQEFAFAVEQSGGDANAAAEGLQKFAVNSSKAAQGSGDLAKIFAANNVALRGADGALRPVSQLLDDVADLIQGATSEQDRLNIATAAFGRSSGPALVLALSGGRQGMADFASQANKAGTVLDDKLIKKAADLDDKIAVLSSSLSGIGKQLAVEFGGPAVTGAMQGLLDFLRQIQFTIDAVRKGNLTDALGLYDINSRSGVTGLAGSKVRAGVGTSSLTSDEIDKFYKRTGAGGGDHPEVTIGGGRKRTVVPTDGGGRRDKEAAAAKRQAEALKGVIDALTLEASQIGKTAEQQELLSRLAQAGVDINSKEGQAIRAKVAVLYELKTAQDAVEQSADNAQRAREDMVDLGKDATKGFVDDLRAGVSAADAFANALDKIASKLLDMAINSLFESAFPTGGGSSGGGGGLFSALGSLFGGGRAAGGPVRKGVPYVVGEKRPELFVPGASGTILPQVPSAPSAVKAAAGGATGGASISTTNISVSHAPVFNMQGGDAELRAYVDAKYKQANAELPYRVEDAVKKAQSQRRLR